MNNTPRFLQQLFFVCMAMCVVTASCTRFEAEKATPRMAMFIGMDISGSFIRGKHFEDALRFASHYIVAHCNGYGGFAVPADLFVGSIGGARANEPKTFFPIQTFQDKSLDEVMAKLREIFPKSKENPYTDFNAFFEQVSVFVKNRNLVLRPISVVMITDGIPDVVKQKPNAASFKNIDVKPLENLSRNITIRVLYTDAKTGMSWQTKVKRRRVKVWTQDADVMKGWKDPDLLLPGKALGEQTRFLRWIEDNVDFNVRSRRVG